MESPKWSNKISEVVRLQQLLKNSRNFANSGRTVTTATAMSPIRGGIHKSISFLKRTISSLTSYGDDGNSNNKKHSSSSSSSSSSRRVVPKGHLAVCVGEELERFVIPIHYLGHPAFGFLLRQAEEVHGFKQTGVLRIPCDVPVFQSALAMVEGKKKAVKNDGLMVKEQCRLSADETFGCLPLDGGEIGYTHLHHSPRHPRSPLCT